jgi:hypothetical protein
MHAIDFLPSAYRQRRRQRRDARWRLTALCATGLLLAVVTTIQHFARVALEEHHAVVRAQTSVVQTQTARLRELMALRQAAAAKATLLAWLSHPWPRSQILACLVGPLPESLTLNSLHISREAPPPNPALPAPSQQAAANPPQQSYLKDLEALRTSFGPGTVAAQLAGVTSDPTALHEYLASLTQQDLIARAELLGVDRLSDDDGTRFRFSIRVWVKPAPGQTAPSSNPSAGSPAAASPG